MKIEFKNVKFSYDKKNEVLRDINFKLEKNEIIFILGHTGSGKSTLIQHLNGLLFPTSGEVKITLNEKEYQITNKEKRIKEIRKNTGMVFQFPENQLFESEVIKDVMFGPMNFGCKEDEALIYSKQALSLVSIGENYYNKSPFDLSGGEKRKVAIAGVLASHPKILVLDEPTSSLDNKSSKEFFSLLQSLKDEGNMIIVVSHDVNLCYEYADKVMILDNGEMTYFGDYQNAFNNDYILESARIEKPFVLKAKEKLNISSDVRNIAQLLLVLKEGKSYE